ncbi:MAG: glutamate-1-semialdehyde 2,1-aminomutase [Fusicatenibacter sp.]|nr:glutamate-1-semialdehyde 2,1-aminomutase [Lachnospiraceae bacterium]MDY2938255.1 glutamate-1-semialdehyde 2,1-aminomutase [Fusicatenibacter sp.]
MNAKKSEELFQEAVNYIPGGVNSPVRAYKAVGMTPRFIERATGPYVFDEDGNQYIDYIGSWGPMILGHNHPEVQKAVVHACANGLSFGAATKIEVEMAKLICESVPTIEMIRMVNSGTEAVMSAVRAARGFTGRSKIIKFEGCYHGHSDCMLVKAGSGVMTAGIPDSAGVPSGCTMDTLTAVYNDLSSVEQLLDANPDQVAAIVVEPLAANMGVVLPNKEFLPGLRSLCDRHGALLIFDEVITGFRLGGFTGAAGKFHVRPDLTTYGKIIGGGMPVGAYGGRKDVMEMVSPVGPVYQAGTLSGNPVAMAAGITQLTFLKDHPEIYTGLAQKGERLFGQIRVLLEQYEMPCTVNYLDSLGCIFFQEGPVQNYAQAKQSDTAAFAKYFAWMLEHGYHMASSQFEAIFLSDAHTDQIIDDTLTCIEDYLKTVRR